MKVEENDMNEITLNTLIEKLSESKEKLGDKQVVSIATSSGDKSNFIIRLKGTDELIHIRCFDK